MAISLPRPRSAAHAARIACLLLLTVATFAFTVFSNGPSDAATTPTTIPAAPTADLDVVLLIDTSNQMLGAPLATAQGIATSYISAMPPEVRVGVVTYGQFPTSMYRLSVNRTGSVGAVGAISAEGNAAVYDGLTFAADQFDIETSSRRQIVVIGSGTDQGSDLSADAAVSVLRQRSIRVDSIRIDTPGAIGSAADDLAVKTGGSRTQWSDKTALVDLVRRTLAWSVPIVKPVPVVVVPPTKSLFENKLVLGVGALLFFAGLTFVLLAVTAPRQKKVNFAGITEVESKRSGSTPMAGIAERLTGAADKVLERQTRTRGLNVTLERAGINLRPGEFLIVAACVLLAIFAILSWMKGMRIAGAITAVLVVLGPRKYVRRKAAKRSMAFGDQLSDTLQLLSSSLRAGQGLMQAIDSVAKEGDAPACDEFRRVVTETRLGRDLIDSLRAMADRIQSEDFNWVIPAIEINREVGGDLAEVLDTVAGTIRDRADIRRQVKTLSAEGRLSAYVLLSLPVGIAAFINFSNPSYLVELRTSPGYYLAGIAILAMIVGGVWLFKLCKIEF